MSKKLDRKELYFLKYRVHRKVYLHFILTEVKNGGLKQAIIFNLLHLLLVMELSMLALMMVAFMRSIPMEQKNGV